MHSSSYLIRLRAATHYDPATGFLIWRNRHQETFTGEEKTREQRCKAWNHRNAHRPAFATVARGYLRGSFEGRSWAAHRVAWFLQQGTLLPEGLVIDHINGNGYDNRWVNLRAVTLSQNQINAARQTTSATGLRGVTKVSGRNRWMARIRADNESIYLGTFKNPEEASRAYEQAASRLHKGFAPLAERLCPERASPQPPTRVRYSRAKVRVEWVGFDTEKRPIWRAYDSSKTPKYNGSTTGNTKQQAYTSFIKKSGYEVQ